MIRAPQHAEVFHPVPPTLAEHIASLSARVGEVVADCAFVIFPLPLAPELRHQFEAETVDAIAGMMDSVPQLTPAERRRFEEAALSAFDRRLIQHSGREGQPQALRRQRNDAERL